MNGPVISNATPLILLARIGYDFTGFIMPVGDFNEDGDFDVYFSANDDTFDLGQSWIALSDGMGGFSVQQSIDFVPTDESISVDVFDAYAVCSDVNLDGHIDLLAYPNYGAIGDGPESLDLYPGDGTGQFGDGQLLYDLGGSNVPYFAFPPCY